jgi:hypothetical protein
MKPEWLSSLLVIAVSVGSLAGEEGIPERASPDGAAVSGEDAILLRPTWKPESRYVWKANYAQEMRISMPGSKAPAAIPYLVENEIEEIVRSGESEGEKVHEERMLSRLLKMGKEGKVLFDSRGVDQPGHVADPSLAGMWEIDRKNVRFTLRDSAGAVKKRWSEGNKEFVGANVPAGPGQDMKPGLDQFLMTPLTLPHEPKSPGDTWPLSAKFGGLVAGHEVTMTGNFHFKGIENAGDRRLAIVEFSGDLVPADPEEKTKVGLNRLEKGRAEGAFSVDFGTATLVRCRVHCHSVMRVVLPGGGSGVRSEIDQKLETSLVLLEPLPPEP